MVMGSDNMDMPLEDDFVPAVVLDDDPPAKPKKTSKVLHVDYLYTSSTLDSSVDDLDTLEAVRKMEVEEYLEYFDSVRDPLTQQLLVVIGIMEGKVKDPYVSLRLPEHLAAVSLSDLQDIVSRLANAYMTYAEYLSAARAINVMRENLYDRRKTRAALNEGSNDSERRALAGLRSEPEFMQKTKVEMLTKYVETRYFAFKSMLEAAQQVMTTKSVEATREAKNTEAERTAY